MALEILNGYRRVRRPRLLEAGPEARAVAESGSPRVRILVPKRLSGVNLLTLLQITQLSMENEVLGGGDVLTDTKFECKLTYWRGHM